MRIAPEASVGLREVQPQPTAYAFPHRGPAAPLRANSNSFDGYVYNDSFALVDDDLQVLVTGR
jgi:hypothetical protein